MGKFYTSIQTDSSFNAPLDSIRISGKKAKKLTKAFKPAAKSYTNPLAQEFSVFKLNLISSEQQVLPSGLGNLKYVNFGSPWNDMTLSQISNRIDSVMTYYKTRTLQGGDSAKVGSSTLESLRRMLKTIDDGFYTEISSGNGDTVKDGRLRFKGLVELYTVPFLHRALGKEIPLIGLPNQLQLPEKFTLFQNYPNPFNPITTIKFNLINSGKISLKVYNILGQEVTTILNNLELEVGQHEVEFNASNLSSGVYFYRINVNKGEFIASKKLLLLK